MGILERVRQWLRGGDDHDEMSESAFSGSPAGAGMGHRHRAGDTLPSDDRGVDGPISHDDPLKPPMP